MEVQNELFWSFFSRLELSLNQGGQCRSTVKPFLSHWGELQDCFGGLERKVESSLEVFKLESQVELSFIQIRKSSRVELWSIQTRHELSKENRTSN